MSDQRTENGTEVNKVTQSAPLPDLPPMTKNQVMDLAMDISAGVEELAHHNPELPAAELIKSGLRIGRSVVGTMTTTLLLAYSGGYITLLMMFASQGTAPLDFLNSTLVSAEVVKTLIGSFSLVLVAPFTAVFAGWLFQKKTISPE